MKQVLSSLYPNFSSVTDEARNAQATGDGCYSVNADAKGLFFAGHFTVPLP